LDGVVAQPAKAKKKKKKSQKPGKPGNARALKRKAKAKKAVTAQVQDAELTSDQNDTAGAKVTDAPLESSKLEGASTPIEAAKQDAEAVDVDVDEAEADPISAPQALAEAGNASIADKLARIRAAVSQRGTSDYAEDQHANDAFGTSKSAAIIPAALLTGSAFDEDDVEAAAEVDVELEAEHTDVEAMLADEIQASQDDTATEAPDLGAAENDDETQQEVDARKAMQAKRELRRARRAARLKAEVEAAAAAEAEVEAETSPEEVTSMDTDTSGDLVTADDIVSSDDEDNLKALDDNTLADETADVPVEAAAETPDPLRRVRARVIKMRRADFEAAKAQDAATDSPIPEDAFDPAQFSADIDAQEDITAEIEQPEEEALDVSLAEDDLEDILRRELGESSLEDDAEDELMRELAEVTGEVSETSDDLEDETTATTDLELDTPILAADEFADDDSQETVTEDTTIVDTAIEDGAKAAVLAALADNDFHVDESQDLADDAAELDDDETRNVFDESDVAMNRLLDTTEREMENGENTRRRNAIQHLKAAVAATRAEKDDAPQDAEEEEDVYREDLARVVRPRRPSESTRNAPRRLAPLMLVSEQRVDTPQEDETFTESAPVRPRRISSAALAVQEEEQFDEEAHPSPSAAPQGADTFADYVETVGAEDLGELLEAATAYSNLVEGRETVTRPQIMRLASQAMPEEFPLEERLRSFGQLLRQGKIRKIKRGHFVIADGTRFKPEAQAS
jgi:hypothetical protein